MPRWTGEVPFNIKSSTEESRKWRLIFLNVRRVRRGDEPFRHTTLRGTCASEKVRRQSCPSRGDRGSGRRLSLRFPMRISAPCECDSTGTRTWFPPQGKLRRSIPSGRAAAFLSIWGMRDNRRRGLALWLLDGSSRGHNTDVCDFRPAAPYFHPPNKPRQSGAR